MDTITHGIVGALVGKAFFAGRGEGAQSDAGGVAIFAATLGAVFPDIDVFAGPIARNDFAVIEWHRSITHSLVCLPVWAVALAALTRWHARRRGRARPSWRALAGIYVIGIASHIFLDVVTSFGTMVWSPVNRARLNWDWVFIVDFTLTALALLPQVVAWVYRKSESSRLRALALWILFAVAALGVWRLAGSVGFPFSPQSLLVVIAALAALFFLPAVGSWGTRLSRMNWCRAGVAVVAIYLSLCGVAHHAAVERVEKFAASRGLQVTSLGALPLPPSFLHWDGLIRAKNGFYEARLDLRREASAEPPVFRFSADAAPNAYIAAARNLPRVKTYLWFARFPVFHFARQDEGAVVEINDLRFFGRPGRPSPFTFRVTFDAQGRVIQQGWAN